MYKVIEQNTYVYVRSKKHKQKAAYTLSCLTINYTKKRFKYKVFYSLLLLLSRLVFCCFRYRFRFFGLPNHCQATPLCKNICIYIDLYKYICYYIGAYYKYIYFIYYKVNCFHCLQFSLT